MENQHGKPFGEKKRAIEAANQPLFTYGKSYFEYLPYVDARTLTYDDGFIVTNGRGSKKAEATKEFFRFVHVVVWSAEIYLPEELNKELFEYNDKAHNFRIFAIHSSRPNVRDKLNIEVRKDIKFNGCNTIESKVKKYETVRAQVMKEFNDMRDQLVQEAIDGLNDEIAQAMAKLREECIRKHVEAFTEYPDVEKEDEFCGTQEMTKKIEDLKKQLDDAIEERRQAWIKKNLESWEKEPGQFAPELEEAIKAELKKGNAFRRKEIRLRG